MNISEHLLTIVSEECVETAHRVSKALRFSVNEVQPGQPFNNGDRIMEEFYDLVAAIERCQKENILPMWGDELIAYHKDKKKLAIEKFLKYSKEVGTLNLF
jgi:hypothetical protein